MILNTNFTPFPELMTERFVLRQATVADADALFQLRNDPVTMEYIDHRLTKDIEEVYTLLEEIEKNRLNGDGIFWVISPKGEDKLIGNIGFWRMKKEHFRAEVGYMLSPVYWRQGIMSEVLKSVLRYGFDVMHLHSVEAVTNPNNTASRQLLEKMGFRLEGHFKEDFYFNGKFLDSTVYGLLGKEFTK